MRIAMLHSTFAVRGGAEKYVEDITAGLRSRGHEVRVFSRDGEEPRLSARLGDRLPGPLRKAFVHLGDLFDPTGPAVGDLRAFRPDVVHVHNWQELGALPVARIAGEFPAVHTVHDHAILDPNNALGTVGRSAALDTVLRLRSAWIRRRFRRLTLLFAAARTRDVIRSDPRDRILPPAVASPWHRLEWPPGQRDVFLFLGALSPHKGLDLLLDAWDPELGTLLVAGDGPLRDLVTRTARDEPSVRYLGYLDESGKRAAFATAGWLVFPSRRAETFGLAPAEALMAGRPVIAAARVRPPTAADSSLLLFHDPSELPKLLARAASMPAGEYARMAASAAADGSRLDWDDHLDALLEIYAEAAP
jgi:glycosyltransferase involved in cell wall biosynthesis